MSYKLYYAEPSAAMGARAILEEIGAPYELIWTDISQNSTREPDLLALNPNGWIPVLVWEEGAIYECGAITVFLCDRHPEIQLAPRATDPDRGLVSAMAVLFLQFFAKCLPDDLLPKSILCSEYGREEHQEALYLTPPGTLANS